MGTNCSANWTPKPTTTSTTIKRSSGLRNSPIPRIRRKTCGKQSPRVEKGAPSCLRHITISERYFGGLLLGQNKNSNPRPVHQVPQMSNHSMCCKETLLKQVRFHPRGHSSPRINAQIHHQDDCGLLSNPGDHKVVLVNRPQ